VVSTAEAEEGLVRKSFKPRLQVTPFDDMYGGLLHAWEQAFFAAE